MLGITAPQNKGMKQTSVEPNGRSQLIPGVGQTTVGMKMLRLRTAKPSKASPFVLVLAVSSAACTNQTADLFIVSAAQSGESPSASTITLKAIAEEALASCGGGAAQRSAGGSGAWGKFPWSDTGDAWIWQPRPALGFRLIVDRVDRYVRIEMDEQRLWPLDRSRVYRCVSAAVGREVVARFGEARVRHQPSDDPPLTAQSGAVAIALVSGALGALWARVKANGTRWALAILVPFLLAWLLYWGPVWLSYEADTSEHSHWAPVLYMMWGLPGALCSLLSTAIMSRGRRAPNAG